jgi:outer membrane receptor protein involved in Fe transport
MLVGRGSTGGVINQVTKKARLAPLAEVTGAVPRNTVYGFSSACACRAMTG